MNSITVVKNGPGDRDCSRTGGGLSVLVYICSYRDCVPRGSFTVLPGRERYGFCGLDQMLLAMEDLMDAACAPGEAPGHRSLRQKPYVFQKPGADLKEPLPGGAAELCSDKAAFAIRVSYRQHRSMQGKLSFQAGGKQEEVSFRSSLELMRMLHEYLDSGQDASRGRTGS